MSRDRGRARGPVAATDGRPGRSDAKAGGPRDGARDESKQREGRGRRSGASPHARHSAFGERYIAGVPARIMRPRLVFSACLIAILAFGLLMVYSASSVEALKTYGDSLYFLKRQAMWIAVGGVFFAAAAKIPLSWWRSNLSWIVWGVIVVALVIVWVAGSGSRGATRWLPIGPFAFQPSEFAKPVLILLAAKIFAMYYEDGMLDTARFLTQLACCVGIPLFFVILQPDLGSCLIIGATLYMMCYMAGFSRRAMIAIACTALLVAAVFILAEPYRMARIFAAADPWDDPYDTGFQATVAMMAFASGGLLGRGIGGSTMKYNYLPEAHNDYILAIIGEEVGFVGTVVLFAVFVAMIVAGLKIASRSPSVQGRLIATGCSCILMIQFLVNALGILGVTPMTGKTLPFISYGGSSMMACLALAGLIFRVSVESDVETVHDERRSSFAVVDESTAGEPRVRGAGRGAFSVMDGGASDRPVRRDRSGRDGLADAPKTGRGPDRASAAPQAPERRGRTRPTGPRQRIDLGPSPRERLRGEGVQRRTGGSGSRGRGSRGSSGTTRRGR